MDELKKYTDDLFAHQPYTVKVQDLKDEIYSNLLAKKQDLINQGFSEDEAIAKTKESILSIDNVIEGNQLTYINRFKAECRQTLLLYATILWILSIPMLIVGAMPFSAITFLLVVAFGISYLGSKKQNHDDTAFINGYRYKTIRTTVWIIWLIFFAVCTVTISAILFGSNIWFARPVQIKGPYEFASIAAKYYIPITTILFPIAIGSFPQILAKNERKDENES